LRWSTAAAARSRWATRPAAHERADDLAAVVGLPRRSAEVGDDHPAAVVGQVRARRDERTRQAGRRRAAPVHLHAGGVTDQVGEVAGGRQQRARGCGLLGLGDLSERQGGREGDEARQEPAGDTDVGAGHANQDHAAGNPCKSGGFSDLCFVRAQPRPYAPTAVRARVARPARLTRCRASRSGACRRRGRESASSAVRSSGQPYRSGIVGANFGCLRDGAGARSRALAS
jgi:hypothetical protein